MVQDDLRAREGLRQLGQVRDLPVVQPGVEAEPQRRQLGEPLAEFGRVKHVARRLVGRVQQARVLIPGGDVADAAEAAIAGGDMRLQHVACQRAVAQVDMADNAQRHAGGAEGTALAHRRLADHELGLAHRLEGVRPGGALHGAALDEDGGDDVVPLRQVGGEISDQVAPVGAVPQVVMRVDDRQGRVQRQFHALGQPLLADRKIGRMRGLGAAHGWFPPGVCTKVAPGGSLR